MALVIPKFNSEREEADWWYEHRDLIEEEFLLAAKEGRLQRGVALKRIREAEAKKLASEAASVSK